MNMLWIDLLCILLNVFCCWISFLSKKLIKYGTFPTIFNNNFFLEFKKAFYDLNIIIYFFGCIGYVLVLDIAINKSLNDKINKLADIFYNKNFAK